MWFKKRRGSSRYSVSLIEWLDCQVFDMSSFVILWLCNLANAWMGWYDGNFGLGSWLTIGARHIRALRLPTHMFPKTIQQNPPSNRSGSCPMLFDICQLPVAVCHLSSQPNSSLSQPTLTAQIITEHAFCRYYVRSSGRKIPQTSGILHFDSMG